MTIVFSPNPQRKRLTPAGVYEYRCVKCPRWYLSFDEARACAIEDRERA